MNNEVIKKILGVFPLNPEEVTIDDTDVITYDIWTDGDELLCRTEWMAERMADLVDALCGDQVAHTGYYDPYEDAKEPFGPYKSTGWYYVDFD